MWKWLAILVGCFVLAVSVSGQPDKTASDKQAVPQNAKPVPVSADPTHKDDDGKANQPKADCNAPAGNAPVQRSHWWADPNWWLVVVAGLTGLVIGWQSKETRKAAQSAERQIALQSNAMRQWVNIEPIKVVTPPVFATRIDVCAHFEVLNKTAYLITIKKIVAHASFLLDPARTFTVSCNVPIPPEKSGSDRGQPFYVNVLVDRTKWFERGGVLVVTGEVTYLDCMGIERTQIFEDLFQGRESGELSRMKPSGIAPEVTDYKAESEQDQRPNPN